MSGWIDCSEFSRKINFIGKVETSLNFLITQIASSIVLIYHYNQLIQSLENYLKICMLFGLIPKPFLEKHLLV